MSLYPPPDRIDAQVWTRLPDEFRVRDSAPEWAAANKPGHKVDSFIEGPSFDREGNLWLTDIPYGRIFRVSPDGAWTLAAHYDGWPNGLKIHRDGTIYIADYKHGILRLDGPGGEIRPVLTHYQSEHFRGCNDLVFDSKGRLYFTDQGQSGMQMANGRVFRCDFQQGRLDLLLDTGQSPNGLVPNEAEDGLYVAMTRGNSIWRLPFMADGTLSKVGVFLQLSGGLSGPDGLALDESGGLWVAHAGNGCVWGFSRLGEPMFRIVSPTGLTTTNLAFRPGSESSVFITESDSGSILVAPVPVAGRPLYSHG